MNATTTAAAPPPVSQAPSASGTAVASLVIGLIGLLWLQILSPVAWYLGWRELQDIAAGLSSPMGRDTARAGMILGIIGTAILGFAVLVILTLVTIAIAALGFAGFAALSGR